MSENVITEEVDPFDLPDWLGETDVVWSATTGLRSGHLVAGVLEGLGGLGGLGGKEQGELVCDLLAVDVAFPAPLCDDRTRMLAHQAWCHGQILLGSRVGRLTLLVPGTAFTADLALDVLARLAKAVGAPPERYAVRLRIGG